MVEAIFAYSLTSKDTIPSVVPICQKSQILPLIYSENYDQVFINNIYTTNNDLIYNLLIAPLLPTIEGKTHLYIRPTGLLSTINIKAIRLPNGQLFGDAYNISIVSNFNNLHPATTTTYSDIALFGDPNFSQQIKSPTSSSTTYAVLPSAEYQAITRGDRGNWSSLPGTRTEVENIKTIASNSNVKNTTFLGSDASESAVKSLSGNSPSIIHLATHGYFIATEEDAPKSNFLQQSQGYTKENQLMLSSGLLFSGSNNVWNGKSRPNPIDDDVLTADEISRLDFAKTKLVVLSACKTGLGQLNETDDVMGLQRAFREAGAF